MGGPAKRLSLSDEVQLEAIGRDCLKKNVSIKSIGLGPSYFTEEKVNYPNIACYSG